MSARPKTSWFAIRQELSGSRSSLLMALSFLVPISLWCIFAYVPFFHTDVKLLISATGEEGTANLIEGDRIDIDFFETFVDKIRKSNLATEETWSTFEISKSRSKRNRHLKENVRRIRRIQVIAAQNNWLKDPAPERLETEDGEELSETQRLALYDDQYFQIWCDLADGKLKDKSGLFTEEDLSIAQKNVIELRKAHGDAYKDWKVVMPPLLQLLPKGASTTPVVLPAPHEVVQSGWEDFTTEPQNEMPWMYERLGHSLKIVFFGFFMACAIGIPLGILCGSFDLFSKFFEPFTDFFRYMPAPTFAMLLIAIFDIHDGPKIALIFLGTFPHMVLMIAGTTKLLDRSLIEAAQTLGAKKDQLIKLIIIPGILPNLYKDLRILLGWAWTWLVIAELIGTKTGLTDFIVTQGTRRNFDRVFPVIFLIGLIGFGTDQLLQYLAKILFPWEYDRKRGWMSVLCAIASLPFQKVHQLHVKKVIRISQGGES